MPPSAASLIESMRDFGYSLETAIADIIDNSITAGASTIWIETSNDSEPMRIAIIDDGHGMSDKALLAAMRPGSRNPLDVRDVKDLGRFGLGMKTASFSQCRKTTVVSRTASGTFAATWNLDLVQERNEWIVELPDALGDIFGIEKLKKTGTLVLWEILDRFSPSAAGTSDAAVGAFINKRLSNVQDHLELVFHRFLSGEPGLKKVKIFLNNGALEPFDPFNSNNPATFKDKSDKILIGKETVKVQPFVLPHFNMVTQQEWDRHAGPGGYLQNQGFYVYRSKRLVLHGTWFGLARHNPRTQLSRVRIDISNALDAEWKIDVKKASAQLPYLVRSRLRDLLRSIEVTAAKPIVGRGHIAVEKNRLPVWQRESKHGHVRYTVNGSHPLLESLRASLKGPEREKFKAVLELIGSALPIDPIFSDLAVDPAKVAGNLPSPESLEYAVEAIVLSLRAADISDDAIHDVLKLSDPFRESWPETSQILDLTLKRNNTQ